MADQNELPADGALSTEELRDKAADPCSGTNGKKPQSLGDGTFIMVDAKAHACDPTESKTPAATPGGAEKTGAQR